MMTPAMIGRFVLLVCVSMLRSLLKVVKTVTVIVTKLSGHIGNDDWNQGLREVTRGGGGGCKPRQDCTIKPIIDKRLQRIYTQYQ